MLTFVVYFGSLKQYVICGNDIHHAIENNWKYIVRGLSGTDRLVLKSKELRQLDKDRYELAVEYYPVHPDHAEKARDSVRCITRHISVTRIEG